MHRRDFLKLSAGVAGGMALVPGSAMSMTSGRASILGKRLFDMSRNWRFSPQRFESAASHDFDDSRFEWIDFPHANRMTCGESFLTYRRKFRLPPGARGHGVLADFKVSDPRCLTVWINGQYVRHGYRYFSPSRKMFTTCDLTPHLNWPGENIVVVEVGSDSFTRHAGNNFDINLIKVQLRLMPQAYVEILGARRRYESLNEGILNVLQFVTCPSPQTARVTLETEIRSGTRVIATGRETLGPAEEIDGVVWVHMMPSDSWAGEFDYAPVKMREYTVISHLKRESLAIDEDRAFLLDSLNLRREIFASTI